MGFCIPIISFLSKVYVGAWTLFPGLVSDVGGIKLAIIVGIISTILIWVMAKLLGVVGGILLIVLGIIGAVFSGGTALILSVIGLILILSGKSANFMALMNALIFVLAIICSI